MSTKIVTPPEAMAVSLQDARNAARANGTELDAEISIFVRAITDEAEHITGRAIIHRTYRATLNEFPAAGAISLCYPPIASVTSVSFYDEGGNLLTLDPQDYVVDVASEPATVQVLDGLIWPLAQKRKGAVMVDYIAGYGPDDTTTPPAFKGFILAKTRENFAPAGTPESPNLVRMLDSMKTYA